MGQFTILAKTFFHSACLLSPRLQIRLDDLVTRLRNDPNGLGVPFQAIERARDPGMTLFRLNKKLGVVLHRTDDWITLLFVGEISEAQSWARRHRVSRHPETGTIQLQFLPPATKIPITSRSEKSSPFNFSRFAVAFLVSIGIPEDWSAIVQGIRDEKRFWEVFEQMPEDAAEYLYALYLGEEITPPKPVTDLEKNLDNRRWMYLVPNEQTIEQILERAFEEWMLFLHPTQWELAYGDFNGPLKVTGSAGTGKTVLAVHRARHFARFGHQVLLTTFTKRLAENLKYRVGQLCYEDEVSRITVCTVHQLVLKLARKHFDEEVEFAFFKQHVEPLLKRAWDNWATSFSLEFVNAEWEHVIDRNGVRTCDEYLAFDRTGRQRGLNADQRKLMWQILEEVLHTLQSENRYPSGVLCRWICEHIEAGQISSPYQAVIVDEIQDLRPEEIRLLGTLVSSHSQSLTLIGDTGQRIYRGDFRLGKLGIETRGRSHRLNLNYRTTMEIDRAANCLRLSAVDNLDGNSEAVPRPRMIRRGPLPLLAGFSHLEDEMQFLVREICKLTGQGTPRSEIGVFARYWEALTPFADRLGESRVPVHLRGDDEEEVRPNAIYMSTLHSAKGLEFRYVFVVRCENGILPLSYALNEEENFQGQLQAKIRERSLLYVAMTRGRDQIWLSWSGRKRSPFLDAIQPFCQPYQKTRN